MVGDKAIFAVGECEKDWSSVSWQLWAWLAWCFLNPDFNCSTATVLSGMLSVDIVMVLKFCMLNHKIEIKNMF